MADHEIMTEIDALALSMLVDAFTQYCKCRAIVEKEGQIIEGVTGAEVAHPALVQMRGLWKEVMQGLREFGMTPSSHSEMIKATADEIEKEDKGRFFKVV